MANFGLQKYYDYNIQYWTRDENISYSHLDQEKELNEIFNKKVEGKDESAYAPAAIETLLQVIKDNKSTTLGELTESLKTAVSDIYQANKSPLSVVSACELFSLFITLSGGDLENPSIEACKKIMFDRGELFSRKLKQGQKIIPQIVLPFITDGCSILTHSLSNTVLRSLTHAAQSNVQFKIYVTMGAPQNHGKQMVSQLEKISESHGGNMIVESVPDTAIGYIMERVDTIIVGAEGITQQGGIVNHIGTYTMALAAYEAKKPFYVLAESYKFMQIYPLNQADLLDDLKTFIQKHTRNTKGIQDMKVDYTPPKYISLLFTDLGVFTTAAVSEKLIELYT